MIRKFGSMPRIFRICMYLFTFDLIIARSSNIVQKFQEHDDKINCDSWEFRCQNGQCIDQSFVCDGSRECVDGTDETRHLCQSKRCNDTQFQCHYGACIEKNQECDGDKKCWDGSDEFPHLCKHIEKIRNRRAADGSCVLQLGPYHKVITLRCKSMSRPCRPASTGYVPEGAKAKIACMSGYKYAKEDYTEHICTGDSTWIPPIGQCAKLCDKLKISNVNFKCNRNERIIDNCTESSILLAGTKIQDIQCKPTYKYKKDPPSYFQISCDESGKWDRPLIPCIPKCGLTDEIAMLAIAHGKPDEIGDSPWHVAIFDKMEQLICGGTIIHELLVISAAHCFIENSKQVVNVDDYEVVVAKYTRQYSTNDNRFQKTYKIREIRFSSSGYDGFISYYQADVAILVLTEKIIMSSLVSPACVNWETLKSGKRPSKGMIGKVVGWGLTESGNASTHLRTTNLPVIDTIDCKAMIDDKNFLRYITIDKFCAGTRNPSGPSILQGDGGGGILFMEGGGYHLRGVISVKQRTSNYSISLFTDLHSHAHTILEIRDQVDK